LSGVKGVGLGVKGVIVIGLGVKGIKRVIVVIANGVG
jgi:hypothetical protein